MPTSMAGGEWSAAEGEDEDLNLDEGKDVMQKSKTEEMK